MTKRKRSKAKGTEKEYKAIRHLKAMGYRTIRSAGSHGPWDVFAYDSRRGRFIQVKAQGVSLSADERQVLLSIPVPPGCTKEAWTDIPWKGFEIEIFL